MRLRDASSETLKNSEPISERVISAVGEVVDRVGDREPPDRPADQRSPHETRQQAGLAVCPSADARATTRVSQSGAGPRSYRA